MANPNPKPGPGRPKGIPNKITTSIKQAFKDAFEELGGVEALVTWAKSDEKNLTEFYKLSTKLIPTEITGKDGGKLEIEHSIPEGDRDILARFINQQKGQ